MYSTADRFLKYVTFDTRSVHDSGTVPSSPGQFELARCMAGELEALGLADVRVSDNCYVTATLPGNSKKDVPSVGFITHLDTAAEFPGKCRPRVVRNYDGGDIVLNGSEGIVLRPSDFPLLKDNVGLDIIVTDGTTLLGADDKAGIAEVMGALEHLVKHPEIEHGDVKIAFTPDEEVGHLAAYLDIEGFGADFAYTLDGGPVGEVSYENFNAAKAEIHIKGRSVHPGTAKGLMVNAILLAQEFIGLFPPTETPGTTELYEGYYHCREISGDVEEVTLKYLIRDHDREAFAARKAFMERCVRWMSDKYGHERFSLDMSDEYYNLRDKLDGKMYIVDAVLEAMRELGIEPKVLPVRGGTDGASLTWRGLITPNFFTGGYNCHGRYEFIPVQSMEQASSVVIKILEIVARKAG
ncbi:MAG: peptidase T [Synergistaceae bacterium]|jgi:tripeptide aminopeptidase|nr:peptidase T [Synergistaceae bacterium]